MSRILALFIAAVIAHGMITQPAQAEDWRRYVEFLDAVEPDTVSGALVRQGKISVQPWKASERAQVERYIEEVFRRVPGLFRLGASQGPIPFYRVNLGSSFGGHGALWLSYFSLGVVAHELTHVSDAEHKIARSAEFRRLVEPRIETLRAAMRENGHTDLGSSAANERKDLYIPLGFPSSYAASTIQETLAEYARARVMMGDFKPPPEIERFLQDRLFDATPDADPSIALYRRGKAARLNGDYRKARIQLSAAIEHDENFAEAYIERGQTLAAQRQLAQAIDDFTAAIALLSEYDWQSYLPYQHRGIAFATGGQYEKALQDLAEAKRLSPAAAGLDAAIRQIEFLLEMRNKRK